MTTASGAREVPFARQAVWEALTARSPYCPVCDVSYVFAEDRDAPAGAVLSKGTVFVCVRGQLNGGPPPDDAVRGEIVELVEQRCVATRLEWRPETWETRIELADAETGRTNVTVTVTHEPKSGNRLLHAIRRKAMQRVVQGVVDVELAQLPAHVGRTEEAAATSPAAQGSISAVEEEGGWVLHLRGEVDASVVDRMGLQRRLRELAVLAIDVRGLTYIDSQAFPPLQRWAKRSLAAGGRPVIRGESAYFDQMLAVMGMTSVFHREG
ncbi:STAS domain-containing protein [Blastococcus litoris]|uniref:STAS domain-containing protein n=1 Tax=Blastococcus litoris TaxID=2171622 RepID=UPI000E3058B3|nr:STAS domain-containing protein [Blastococcus litoris]